MMTKFTPGPWSLWRKGDPSQVIAAGRVFVAQTVGGNDQANAHLIAAAPDLYEALESIQAEATRLRAKMPPSVFARIVSARAALAKANGEAK